MRYWAEKIFSLRGVHLIGIALLLFGVFLLHQQSAIAQTDDRRLITVYDRGDESTFLTDQKTIRDALNEQGIELDKRDTVEPALSEELVAPEYHVNIYRARPVVVVDGALRLKTITPFQVASRIAEDVGVALYPEDITSLKPSTDFIGDGAGLELTIERATLITLDLYTQKTEIRTQAKTVGDMLKEKGIVLGENGRVSVPESTLITVGMEIRVWREGKQIINSEETAPFETERIFDADRPVGYKAIQTSGVDGVLSVTYEIEVREAVELSRVEIARIVTKLPVKQVEIVGIKPNPNSLTKSKGAHIFVDSQGVRHRETYYDLPMNVVMQACGQAGYYEVRVDGVKIDRDGYVIIAANLNRYPRCSVVETSLGPAKIYDTGGFAAVHPDGYDIATDWTNNNGR